MSWQPGRPIGYAHRGFCPDGELAGQAMENTLGAFAAAVELGYRHLETDVRASADGVAVTFHDRLLDRLTNHTGPVAALNWQQLRVARVYGREPIPRLEDVLATFDQVHLNIDVKSDAAIGPTLDAIGRTRAWSRVRLAAFSHRRLLRLRAAAGPQVASALSPLEVTLLRAAGRSGRGPLRRWPAGADLAAQVPVRAGRLPVLTAEFVRTAHAAGIAVHAWTINEPAEMSRLLDLGVDAIVTDRAELLRALLIERGHWPG